LLQNVVSHRFRLQTVKQAPGAIAHLDARNCDAGGTQGGGEHGIIGAVRREGRLGVSAQKGGRFWARSIVGSHCNTGGCRFRALEIAGELLALGIA
jgi:hypothetical protein